MILALLLACSTAPAPGPLQIDDADRSLMLTIRDLATAGFVPKSARGGQWTKFLDEDGNIKLTYEYRRPHADPEPLFVGSYVFVQRDPSTAEFAFQAAMEGTRMGLSSVETIRRDEVLGVVQRHECTIMQASGMDVGTTCAVLHEQYVYLFMVSGTVAFANPGSMDDVLGPKIARLQGYIPTATPLETP